MEFKWGPFVGRQMLLIGVICVVAAHCGIIDSSNENNGYASYKGVTVYAPSHECKMLGGLCVHEGDCEKDNIVHKRGLCPDRDIGVECCYEVIPRSAPCQTFGGVCMDECGVTVQQTLVNDCGDKKCCIQVNLIN